jgi:hypothetical protein
MYLSIMKTYKIALLFFALVSFGIAGTVSGAPNKGQPFRKDLGTQHKRMAGGCDPAKAQTDLNINNVRARIFSCGDMWWDLVGLAKYEIPKVTEANQVSRTSLFAGSLWIGGFENNNLKIAAMTYRQSGVDFFTGPLDTITASTNSQSCQTFDRIYQITRKEINDFIADPTTATSDITDWPGNGKSFGNQLGLNIESHLAPYIDGNHNGIYDPTSGSDFPDVKGDQALWYVYNDKGATHGETKGDAIGLECKEMAFAFTTDDELNDMTFYKTTVINRSSNKLDSTWFGQWVDADLGYAFDDYVGCDVTRNLGYCYNGEDIDPGVTGYGKNPPSVGVGFFHGPVDSKGKEIGLKKFIYYNNDGNAINGNPGYPNTSPGDYYNYLAGHWKNGDCVKFGQDGVKGSVCTDFMFPGDPSYSDQSGGWTERSAGNKPGDRRFLESSGPFTLMPGAKNDVTVAVMWARALSGGATGSLSKLKLATDLAKITYNNDFNILYGADAPDVVIRELDRKLILNLENTNTANVEKYAATWKDKDNNLVNYKFQGYLVYQLVNSSVSRSEYDQPDKAQLIAQVDLKDEISGTITNYDTVPGVLGKVNVIKVNGQANAGLSHTFQITSDAFATGDKSLVNYKQYYFSVISYSTVYPKLIANYEMNFVGSKHNVNTYIATPHKNDAEFGGTKLHTDYGSGPEITRIEGTGNGGNILDFTQTTINEILQNGKMANPTYAVGHGPVNVKVIDPTLILKGNYDVRLLDSTIPANAPDGKILSYIASSRHPKMIPTGKWQITNEDIPYTINSNDNITVYDEQILFNGSGDNIKYWGMSAAINQVFGPGGGDITTVPAQDITNGFLEATMQFNDLSNQWLSGVFNTPPVVSTAGVPTPENWIRCGQIKDTNSWNAVTDAAMVNNLAVDPFCAYSDLLGGIIAPTAIVVRDGVGTGNSLTMGDIPSWVKYSQTPLTNLNSVDLVLTSDKSKWSQCVVLEMGEAQGLNEGGAKKFDLRAHNGIKDPNAIDANGKPVYDGTPGMSWFPGYAVNLETGDRLNVFFSEDSHFPENNGADMIWNPTGAYFSAAAGFQDYVSKYIWGGKHWIYVMNSIGGIGGVATNYDGCGKIYTAFKSGTQSDKQKAWSSCIWVMEPLLAYNKNLLSYKDGLIPTETKIRLRVAKPYATMSTSGTPQNNNKPFYKFTTDDIAAERTAKVGKDALQEVGISPNPYYASSAYETNQLDNRVRFVNVPSKCEITVFTLDGVMIRKFTIDQTKSQAYQSGGAYPATYLDWDLKNQAGVPVASGVYLIHINGFDLGEKVIKWFGVTKPIDLDTF